MNLYPAAAYFRHLLVSRSAAGHGVHSPFIFDFLDKVLRGKTDKGVSLAVEHLRRDMLCDVRKIQVTDMGAGSARESERRIRDITQSASVPLKYAELLSRMVQGSRYQVQGDGIILELGTSLGISALAMALAAPERRVVTVEGCPKQAEIAAANLKKYGAANAEVLNMEFTAALDRFENEGIKVSFAFIDGNHRGEVLSEYVRRIARMGEEMIITADDIHLTRDMYRAWRTIVASGIAKATMETMRFGILFCIRRISPGAYRIRY